NPQVSGRGMAMLEAAGIDVEYGLLGAQAEALNTGFLKRMRTQRPFVTCKLAASIDGKTALANGQSKWITCSDARADVHSLRAQHCAIVSGADTVISDNAQLNVRLSEQQLADYPLAQVRQPVRVIIDSRYRLTPDLALMQTPGKIIIVRSRTAPALDKVQQWPNNVTELYVAGDNDGHVDLDALLTQLAADDINSLWLEGGATLAGAFAKQQLIDRYVVYLAPKLMGQDAKGLVNIGPFADMNDIEQMQFSDMRPIGEDVCLTLDKRAVE
ncbi:bifunctional diaminohydroxyphosphoribosylaminopyrimidine deaminase/5-amino-6-(5-phosphoribosylamino)uracil reductase RibD, partial [Pseudoalteromonas ruthenica]|uniref:bifunctional diaminohydroxyphosphoribosylaminopyrimidine deaminase/5-amino-6-(5-phosphoribosylamino)uracil reductase RibD n=1 Tax=Pseudoalteromonas ruthenica TaxID=151081 RepID=UPI0003B6CB44